MRSYLTCGFRSMYVMSKARSHPRLGSEQSCPKAKAASDLAAARSFASSFLACHGHVFHLSLSLTTLHSRSSAPSYPLLQQGGLVSSSGKAGPGKVFALSLVACEKRSAITETFPLAAQQLHVALTKCAVRTTCATHTEGPLIFDEVPQKVSSDGRDFWL